MRSQAPILALIASCLVLLLMCPGVTAISPVVTAGSGCGPAGTTVQVPLVLSGTEGAIGNVDLTISYDPAILQATQVLKGDLASSSLFDFNLERGVVKVGIASRDGFQGGGTLAYLIFRIIETSGSSPVHLEGITANNAKTLEPIAITAVDGSVVVLAGIRFVTEGSAQTVIIDPSRIGADIRIDGDTVICSQCGLVFTIHTSGITGKDGTLQGSVRSVTITSPPVAAELSFGRVEGHFEFSLPLYPTEGYFSMTFTETVDAPTRQAFEEAARRRGGSIIAIPFLALISDKYGKTGPAIGHFTVPMSLIDAMGGMENIWFGHVSDYVSPELLKAELESGPNPQGMVTLRVLSPHGISIFGMTWAKVKEIANPTQPGATPTPPGQTPLTIFANIILSSAQLGTGNLIVGTVMIVSLLSIAVVGIYYVHKKRGG